jgi:SAM-dependent methyltransferase
MTAIRRVLIVGYASLLLATFIATAISFPWSVDPQGDESFQAANRRFYEKAYSSESKDSKAAGSPSAAVPLSAKNKFYIDFARNAAVSAKIPQTVADFVKQNGLKDKKVLEVGAGSGMLQDVVEDYTALDISPTARQFFHKPFVEASATAMPFADNSFDGLWSIWVLEHIPNPEKALLEIRRVVKPGGFILLHVANDVDRYAAQGYRVRPYGDFGFFGRLKKATIPIMDSTAYQNLQARQVRLLRSLGSRLGAGPSRLHFIKLDANYDDYWVSDSDACTSVSFHEVFRWFISRGDHCANCPSEWNLVFLNYDYHNPNMVIRIVKN